MPDHTGLLNAQDNEIIQKWWNQHWKAPVVCPVCKTSEWGAAAHVVNIQRYAVDSTLAGTVSYPHIVVGCKNCAHSMFFNAVQVGIPQPAPPPPPVNALANVYTQGLLGSLYQTPPVSPPPNEGLLSALLKKDK